jgi:hypothetical protein
LSKRLNSHTIFQAAAGNSIWKLLCNASGILVGEERDPETRVTSFFAIDLNDGRRRWSDLHLGEKWWLSILEITEMSLYIQHYAEGPLPTPSGVTCIDLQLGEARWSVPNVAYFTEEGDEAILLQQGMLQQQYFVVDIKSGEMLRKINAEDLPQQRSETLEHLSFPSMIDVHETGSSEVQQLLASVAAIEEIRGSIEYFRKSDVICLSFYSRDTKDAQAMLENKLVLDLAIFDADSQSLLFSERLSISLNYPVQGSYFLFNADRQRSQLLYVKESNQLRSIAFP